MALPGGLPEEPAHAPAAAPAYATPEHEAASSASTAPLLRAAGGLHRLLVDGVHDYAIFALDPDGYVLSWNAGAQHRKGYVAEEIIGRHFSTFYPPERIAEGFATYELAVAARVGSVEDEGRRLRKDGSRFWANVVITALRDENGTFIGFAKVTRDLTERRAAQVRALADARRIAAAEAASRTKSEFLAAMSHELRTPINATLGYAELIELGIDGPVTERQREHLGRIRASPQHLLQIISDLLNYSRVEPGQVEYERVPVSIDEVLAVVLAMVKPQAAAKPLVLERGPCAEGTVARADRTRVQQVLLNLLSNAVKFTPAGGHVTVACSAADDRVSITVSDTGPGIPLDMQQAIFEPFVQVGRSLTSGHEGTGLGVAISRDLARAMGGVLTAESTLGQGSAFTLTLPAA